MNTNHIHQIRTATLIAVVAAVTVLLGGLAGPPATAAVTENLHFVDSNTFDVGCGAAGWKLRTSRTSTS